MFSSRIHQQKCGMATSSVFTRLIVFILVQIIILSGIRSVRCGLDVLCPGVKVESSSPPPQPAQRLPPYPSELLYAYQRMPYFPPFPYFPQPVPAAPSYCVQSVVVSGNEDYKKKNKTSVSLEKAKRNPVDAHRNPQAHGSAVMAQTVSPHHAQSSPAYTPAPTLRSSAFDHHKCEIYLEKLLRMLKEKSDTSEETSERHIFPRRKKLRRKKRKYHLASIEEDCSPVVIVQGNCRSDEEDVEEDERPTYVIKKTRRRRRIKSSRTAFLHEED